MYLRIKMSHLILQQGDFKKIKPFIEISIFRLILSNNHLFSILSKLNQVIEWFDVPMYRLLHNFILSKFCEKDDERT